MENPEYSIIKTEDGTSSIFSKSYGQAMHSMSGAYQEALLKHVYPSKILDSPAEEVFVLDIGFGIGYNILALVYEFVRKKPGRKLCIISMEKDISHKSLMNAILFNDDRDGIYGNIRDCLSRGKVDAGLYSIEIKFGDARDSIKTFNNILFDAVFHDPYSPAKNPELWSVEFFTEVNRLMKEGAVLTTYSSASQIRAALMEAGFHIGRGPSVGRKREGTIASRGNYIQELSREDIRNLKSDIKSTPYRDRGLRDAREEISNRRITEMRAARLN